MAASGSGRRRAAASLRPRHRLPPPTPRPLTPVPPGSPPPPPARRRRRRACRRGPRRRRRVRVPPPLSPAARRLEQGGACGARARGHQQPRQRAGHLGCARPQHPAHLSAPRAARRAGQRPAPPGRVGGAPAHAPRTILWAAVLLAVELGPARKLQTGQLGGGPPKAAPDERAPARATRPLPPRLPRVKAAPAACAPAARPFLYMLCHQRPVQPLFPHALLAAAGPRAAPRARRALAHTPGAHIHPPGRARRGAPAGRAQPKGAAGPLYRV
jgi:hypothetical protein